jgi:hypothetical protein
LNAFLLDANHLIAIQQFDPARAFGWHRIADAVAASTGVAFTLFCRLLAILGHGRNSPAGPMHSLMRSAMRPPPASISPQ